MFSFSPCLKQPIPANKICEVAQFLEHLWGRELAQGMGWNENIVRFGLFLTLNFDTTNPIQQNIEDCRLKKKRTL